MTESVTTPRRECPTCNTTISPGDHRIPSKDGPQHRLCEIREQLEDRYRFHIFNPPNTEAYGYSLWQLTDAGRERIILQNTGGTNAVLSESTDVGHSISPSETFFNAVAYSHHWLMCLMSGIDPEEIDKQIDMWYGEGMAPDHERWAIHLLVAHFHPPTGCIPELADLREYIDGCTEWGTPEVMEGIDE